MFALLVAPFNNVIVGVNVISYNYIYVLEGVKLILLLNMFMALLPVEVHKSLFDLPLCLRLYYIGVYYNTKLTHGRHI